jgi:hypothetical protein
MQTADDRYAANMRLLRENPNPILQGMPEQLAQMPLTNLHLLPSGDGALYGQAWDCATQQWVALCNPQTPLAEAEVDAGHLYTPNAKVFCLIGLGMGYFAVALAKRLKPYQRLVIWDLDPCMYKAMLHAVDCTPFFDGQHRVDLIVGDAIIQNVEPWWLGLEAAEKLHILPPLRAGYTAQYHVKEYDALLEKTADMMRFHAVGLATWKAFGSCIGDNDLLNMPEYLQTPGYEHIGGLWKDKPAVCIAAGPSLQKNLRYLLPEEVRSKIAVITAGTTYALTQGMGLQPDIVTTIDFQRLNWTDQFQYVPLDADCSLVYLHSTYPQTVRRWPGPKFVAENSSDTVNWLRQYGDGKKSAAQVQTVAHLNLLVALEIGANPIILLGQDLSMPLDTHHAAGARAQDMAPNDAPAEAFVEVMGYDGKPAKTRHSFLSMKTVFERIIIEHPETTFLNCTEGGLALAGARNMPLLEALALIKSDTPAQSLRSRLAQSFCAYKPKILETLPADFRRLQGQVEDLAQFSRDVLRLAHLPQMPLKDHEYYACLSSDISTTQETQESLWIQNVGIHILAHEQALKDRQAAFGLFAIRHFGLLELLSAIPPDIGEHPSLEAQQRVNCDRLIAVARMIDELLPTVRYLLRTVGRRLDDVFTEGLPTSPRQIQRLCAKQHYSMALRVLRQDDALKNTLWIRLYAHLLYQTQQYEASCVLFGTRDDATAKVARMQKHIADDASAWRQAIPAYFPVERDYKHLMSLPDVGQSGDMIGA